MVSGITPCVQECKWIVYFGETPMGVDVYGFDTGVGVPKPMDYCDLPNLYTEGDSHASRSPAATT
jgi:hypothetical protein